MTLLDEIAALATKADWGRRDQYDGWKNRLQVNEDLSAALFNKYGLLSVVAAISIIAGEDLDAFTRIEIQDLTGLSSTAVANQLKPMIKAGILEEERLEDYRIKYLVIEGPRWDAMRVLAAS